jgi:hypothetical protein
LFEKSSKLPKIDNLESLYKRGIIFNPCKIKLDSPFKKCYDAINAKGNCPKAKKPK